MTESQIQLSKYFGRDVFQHTKGTSMEIVFDSDLRKIIEPHIAKARKVREEKRWDTLQKLGVTLKHQDAYIDQISKNNQIYSITSSSHIPYPSLRIERPFLFDTDTYPLHKKLCEALSVNDLQTVHLLPIDKKQLLQPLLDAKKRRAFHLCFDNFVTTFCIPLLHSFAITEVIKGFQYGQDKTSRIGYRYQAFPCIRVIRPGDFSIGPHSDTAYGHSVGNINFHVPLTATYGTNALYTESYPGREDWHPLRTKSVGLGFTFDGARCIHFTTENTTETSRVSLDFRIAVYRYRGELKERKRTSCPSMNTNLDQYSSTLNSSSISINDLLISENNSTDQDDNVDIHDGLCNSRLLEDNFSAEPGYYEYAYIDQGIPTSSRHMNGPIVQKLNNDLLNPDYRVGFPFSSRADTSTKQF